MEELAGLTVMVHPNVTHDPLNMQGEIGAITKVFYEDCASCVEFTDERVGVYNHDTLYMLMPTEIILEKLVDDIFNFDLNPSEVLDIFKICMLNEVEKHERALKWAWESPAISEAIVFSVQDWIDLQIERLDQQQDSGIGR